MPDSTADIMLESLLLPIRMTIGSSPEATVAFTFSLYVLDGTQVNCSFVFVNASIRF
ncbi:hypothetical protein D3C85_1836980 [compost metagenome]